MNEQARKKIAELERALQIAAEMFSNAGYFADGHADPEYIAKWILRVARKELKREAENRAAEAIKKHPRAQ